MKRNIIEQLIEWNREKPVLLTGPKGAGKTYLAYDYSKSFFDHILYMNFERNPGLRKIFCLDSGELKDKLIDHFKISSGFSPKSAILILDEISFCPEILDRFNYMKDSGLCSNILMITSQSLDTIDSSFDSSEVLRLPVHPLGFDEFLLATANDWYIETIRNHYDTNKPLPPIVHEELLALHELYLQIGGMPNMINEYLNSNSTINIPEQHGLLSDAYYSYILNSNHGEGEALKMNQVINSLPQQLLKENKKFQYKLIRKGTTHTMYQGAIRKLCENSYIYQSMKYTTQDLIQPHAQTPAVTAFKLYNGDVGMLYSRIMQEQYEVSDMAAKKALLENYTAQALDTNGYSLFFWESDSMAKVDFILSKKEGFIPIEIFCGDNTRSKSMSVLRQKIEIPYGIKISSKNFGFDNHIKYIPYYAVFCL